MKKQLLPTVVMLLIVAATAAAEEATNQARIVRDLPYKSGENLSAYEKERCRLDLYLPSMAAQTKDSPVLVFFHGGAIQNGDKESTKVIASLVNRHGIPAVGVNYRLSPKVKYPEYLRDAAAAIVWVKANAAKYGGSPKKIFVSGHSAGGYLTMMSAIGPGFFEDAGLKTSDIAGLIPISGQMVTHSTVREERGLPRSVMIVDEAAPLYHVRKDLPPALFVCGDNDLPARLEESLLMHAWLKAAGNTNGAVLCVPGRDHGTIYEKCADPDDPAGKAIVEFIQKHSSDAEKGSR